MYTSVCIASSRHNYWWLFTSPEATILLHPKKIVIEYLVHIIVILGNGSVNNDLLNLLSQNDNSVTKTAKGRNHLRIKFLYLKIWYKNSIHYMNNKTWQQCCQLRIETLADNGIDDLKSKRSIMK